MEHTKKEKEIINEAWRKLVYCADCTSNTYRLEKALKHERKERKNLYTAKALILGMVVEMISKPPMPPYELAGISEGILLGGLIGCQSLERVKNYPNFRWSLLQLIKAFQEARDMHSEACDRNFLRLSAEISS